MMKWHDRHLPLFLAISLGTLTDSLGQEKVTNAPTGFSLPVELQKAVCTIVGDTAKGTGFVANFNGKAVVVTNQHLIVDQKKLRIRNIDGVELKPTSGVLAGGADVALLLLSKVPDGIKPFDVSDNVTADAKEGDEVLIIGNTLGAGTLTTTRGTIKSFGPTKIEHTAPTFSGNSGSPIFHVKSSKVLGVDTESKVKMTSERLDDKSSAKREGAAVQVDEVRLFGHRIDTVGTWVKLDWTKLSKISGEIEKVQSLGSDALIALVDGRFAAINDRVLRDKFVRADKRWDDPKVSDTDAYNHFVRAVESMTESLVYNMKRIEKVQDACFFHKEQVSELRPKIDALVTALDIVKSDIKTARSLHAGKYEMSVKVKALLYPDGTILLLEK